MWDIYIQVLNKNTTSEWWTKLITLFSKKTEHFEIRCWNEEQAEIAIASGFSNTPPIADEFETSIVGEVSEAVIHKLKSLPKPLDKHSYNKMTPFFTVNIGSQFHSEHYGTEVFLCNLSADDVKQIKTAMTPYH